MATIEIICEDCGQPRQTRWKNTKKCKECRFLTDISYGHQIRTCKACKHEYQPIRRKDNFCGEHSFDSPTEVTCAFCGREDFSVFSDLKVCSECARNPAYRKRFLRSLLRRQDERRTLYNAMSGS